MKYAYVISLVESSKNVVLCRAFSNHLLQPFQPPTPPPSLTPSVAPTTNFTSPITRDKIREALLLLIQVCITMFLPPCFRLLKSFKKKSYSLFGAICKEYVFFVWKFIFVVLIIYWITISQRNIFGTSMKSMGSRLAELAIYKPSGFIS